MSCQAWREPADLFPLPHLEPPPAPGSGSRRLWQRYRKGALDFVLANLAIDSLNSMYLSSSLDPVPPSSSIPSASQQRALHHILDSCRSFRRRLCDAYGGLPRFSDPRLPGATVSWLSLETLSEDPLLFHYLLRTQAAEIKDANKVSIPDTPPPLRLLDVLPDEIASRYADVTRLLRPADEVRPAPSAHLVPKPVYLALLRRLHASGRVEWTKAPKAVNGFFGVEKPDGAIRLITDCRPANAHFIDSPPVELPTPDVLASLEVPGDAALFTAKTDLSDFFHQFLLPEELRPYFALPSVRAGELGLPGYDPGEEVWPMLTTVPMGWSHAVYVTQKAHEQMVRRAGIFDERDFITADGDACVSRTRIFIYIDDVGILGTDQADVDARQRAYEELVSRYGLRIKDTKKTRATSTGVDALGVRVDNTVFGLSAEKLASLAATTIAVLEGGPISGKQLARLIGSWVWALLPCRPLLSVLRASYRFVATAWNTSRALWRSVRNELHVLVGLLPVLRIDLAAQWSGTLLAADSSSRGYGVVYAGASPGHVRRLASDLPRQAPTQAGVLPQRQEQAVEQIGRAAWSVAITHRWRESEHISVLELRAALAALKWAASRPSSFRRRILLLSDSASTVGALAKGRSPAFSLLLLLRRVAVVCTGFGVRLVPRWIPTQANPADGPSRSIGR